MVYHFEGSPLYHQKAPHSELVPLSLRAKLKEHRFFDGRIAIEEVWDGSRKIQTPSNTLYSLEEVMKKFFGLYNAQPDVVLYSGRDLSLGYGLLKISSSLDIISDISPQMVLRRE